MSLTLALALTATLPAQTAPDLAFRGGRLTGWEGSGFYVTTATGQGPSLACGVCSSDRGRTGHTAILHRTFLVPPGVGAIRFTAAAVRAPGCKPGPTLDVVLEAAGRQFLPKQVLTAAGPKPAPTLLPFEHGRPREYLWSVSAYAGQAVRIAIVDEDDRPGCFVFCSGFHLVSAEEFEGREFARHVVRLEREHHLAPMARFETRHFLAMSNAEDAFTEHRLYNCETIYELFFDHFRRKGFAVREPGNKLMVAIFDSQTGFEAYLGGPTSLAITGVYHRPSNRLVVYDFGQNRAFLAQKERGERTLRQAPSGVERQRVLTSFSRQAQDWRTDVNIGTIVHEVAHQLSFNGGLLNREGDVALWLAEGLACYCEATDNGAWQGIGEANPHRASILAGPARGQGSFIPLKELIGSDDWLRKAGRVDQILLGYAQSWALFQMLIEERPKALRRYLELIGDRQTPDYRLTDFVQAFGDLTELEKSYQAYLREVVRQQVNRGRTR
jgi:hypothetical protein